MSFNNQYQNLIRSRLKVEILTQLLNEDKILADLVEKINSSGSTILHALKDLEIQNLTFKESKKYKLTSLGRMQAILINEVFSAIEVLKKFQDYWLFHDITPIPPKLIKDIGLLQDSILIQNGSTELERVHASFQQILFTSKNVKGVSPIFHSDYVKIFRSLLEDGATIELILTNEVLKKILPITPQEMDEFVKYLINNKLKLFIKDDLKIALTVTENSFSFGLFTKEGEYDYSFDIISNSKNAIEWGNSFFQYQLQEAKIVDVEVLTRL